MECILPFGMLCFSVCRMMFVRWPAVVLCAALWWVCLSVFSIMCSELLIMSEISWLYARQCMSTRVLSVRSCHL